MQQLGAVRRIALHALARALVVPVDLRGVPPGGVVVGERLRRALQILLAFVRELLRARSDSATSALSMRSPGTAAQFLVRLASQPTLMYSLRVVAFVHVREPVVGHELNPERGQHVEERRLLVIAVGVL